MWLGLDSVFIIGSLLSIGGFNFNDYQCMRLGVVQGEINNAVRQLTSARTCSVEAMGAVRTSPLPHAASTAGQPCAPAEGKTKKVRKVHIHGKAPTPAVQSCATEGGSPGGLLKKEEPEGKQDVKHTISERTLSEIVRILKAAGSRLAVQLPGLNADVGQAMQLLRRVLDGADETRVLRSVRDLTRLECFAGASA